MSSKFDIRWSIFDIQFECSLISIPIPAGPTAPQSLSATWKKPFARVFRYWVHRPFPCSFWNSFALKEKNLPLYCRAVKDLQKKYAGPTSAGNPVEILLGIEVDFIRDNGFIFGAATEISFRLYYRFRSPRQQRKQGWALVIDGPDISIYDNGIQGIFGVMAAKL